MILEEKSKIFIFSLQYKTLIFLNQGQGSIFKIRECAQSIPRLEKPKNRRFSLKNSKMFDFRFNTPTPFSESGSGKHFQDSGMRGIDFSHKITPIKVIFKKISEQIFFRKMTSKIGKIRVFFATPCNCFVVVRVYSCFVRNKKCCSNFDGVATVEDEHLRMRYLKMAISGRKFEDGTFENGTFEDGHL
jgi:hypothetical protein